MKNRIDSSRQKTPWDNSNNITNTQFFIKKVYKDNYIKKHPALLETNENDILNNIEIKQCAYCNSFNIKKYGKTRSKLQVYFCKNCNRRFTPTTGTIFENHKISITEWVEFLLDIFNYSSTSLTSKINKNSINTSIFWLNKVFLLLKECQNSVILKGTVYIDEFFYSVIKSDLKTKDGKKLRGLSKNQYCIGIGYDKQNIVATVEGMGKTSTERTNDAFMKHIEPESHIIHDDEKSHIELIEKLRLIDESYKSTYLKTLDDKENPLRPINHQCDLIRQFLNTHSGFDRKYLQDYLNLYCFMNSRPNDKLEKVNILLNLALTKKATLHYRELFGLEENKNH